MELYRTNPSWTQPLIAIGVNKRLKGKEVKRNTISHVLKYTSDLGGSWQLQKVEREKRPQHPKLESALLAWFKQIFIFYVDVNVVITIRLYVFLFHVA